jgi:hypothetical protein
VSDTWVHRDIVVKVLKAHDVDVSSDGDNFTLAKEGVPIQTYVLTIQVERKMLFRFQYRYKVPIHLFFHPDMLPPTSGEKEIIQ